LVVRCSRAPPALLSFPTRRSSDLAPLVAGLGALVALRGRVPSAVSRHLTRVPASVRDGLGAGLRAAALLLALGLAVVVLAVVLRSEEHTSELQSRENLVCRLLLEK